MLYAAACALLISVMIAFTGYSVFTERAPSMMARAAVLPLMHELQRNSHMICSVAGERSKADLLAGGVVSKDHGEGLFSWEVDVSVSQGKQVSLIIENDGADVVTAIGAAFPSFSLPGNAEAVGLHVRPSRNMNIPDLYINVASESPTISEDGCT